MMSKIGKKIITIYIFPNISRRKITGQQNSVIDAGRLVPVLHAHKPAYAPLA